MLNIKNISKIGIGTWGIGGFAERNPQNDDKKQIDALIHMLNSGLNFVEANLWYSQGKSVELLATALRNSNVKRENIFICQAVYIKNGDFETAERERSYQHLKFLIQIISILFNLQDQYLMNLVLKDV